MKLKYSAVFGAMLACSIVGQAADKPQPKASATAAETAAKQIDTFTKRMQATDQGYQRKESRLLAVIPYLTATYPANQWAERVEFLYGSFGAIDAAQDKLTADSVWSAYYADEKERADLSGDRTQALNTRLKALREGLASGQMPLLEQAGRMMAAANVYFPGDKLATDMGMYRLNLAIRVEKGELTPAQFDALWAVRLAQHNGTIEQAQATAQAQAAQTQNQSIGAIFTGIANGLNSVSQTQRQQMQYQTRPVSCSTYGNQTICQ